MALTAISLRARLIGGASRLALLSYAVLWASEALAAQGPGTGAGTASHVTQWAMAILVYGTCALVVGCGLIGALRAANQRRQ